MAARLIVPVESLQSNMTRRRRRPRGRGAVPFVCRSTPQNPGGQISDWMPVFCTSAPRPAGRRRVRFSSTTTRFVSTSAPAQSRVWAGPRADGVGVDLPSPLGYAPSRGLCPFRERNLFDRGMFRCNFTWHCPILERFRCLHEQSSERFNVRWTDE